MQARPHPNIAYTWDESYTLPENLYLAWRRGAGRRYRELAARFLLDADYFAPLARGENGEAASLASACEVALLPVGDPECMAWTLVIDAMACLSSGDHAGAVGPLKEALRAFHDLGALWGLSLGLFVTAQSAGAHGDQHGQVVLLGASEYLRITVGAGQLPFVAVWLDAAVASSCNVLGEEAFNRAWRAGQALPLHAAVAEAMRAGLAAIIDLGPERGALRVGAGNYGGKLGRHHYHLKDLLR